MLTILFVADDVNSVANQIYKQICHAFGVAHQELVGKVAKFEQENEVFLSQAQLLAAKISGPLSKYYLRRVTKDHSQDPDCAKINIGEEMERFSKLLGQMEADLERLGREYDQALAERDTAYGELLGEGCGPEGSMLLQVVKAEISREFGSYQKELEQLADETVAELEENEKVGPLSCFMSPPADRVIGVQGCNEGLAHEYGESAHVRSCGRVTDYNPVTIKHISISEIFFVTGM
jgi:hypothetical protein